MRNKVKPFTVAHVCNDSGPSPAWVRDDLIREGIVFLSRMCSAPEDLIQYARDADLVWVWGDEVLTAGALASLPCCRAILRTGSGADNVPIAKATESGIIVANTPTAASDEVSNHAIGLLLAVVRQIPRQDQSLREGIWDIRMSNHRWHLRGQVLGLVGFGHVGQLVAQKMVAFGMDIQAFDPYCNPKLMENVGVHAVRLDEVVSKSDFISLHCPLTKATYHLIGERELGMMKRNAVLINTSRGAVVDEVALARFLKEGRIGAAGLDVFEKEPIAADNPLLSLENVVVTPHIAGYGDTFMESSWRESVDTVIRLAKGYWPRSLVNTGVKPLDSMKGSFDSTRNAAH